jgi:hypothetical protein
VTKVVVHDLDLPMFLWAEACSTNVYILNRCPRVSKDKILEKDFIGEKLPISHFHVFGCLVYIHIFEEKRTKLEPPSLKGVFLDIVSPPRLMDSTFVIAKIVVNRDVKFYEGAWSSRSQEPPIEVE